MNSLMLKELHDQLLAAMPEGASHDEKTCPVCNGEADLNEETHMTKTHEEELANANTQISDLQSKIQELEALHSASETDAKIAEVKAQADEYLAAVLAELDSKVLAAEKAKTEKDELVAYLDKLKTDLEAEEAADARKGERIDRVKAEVNFPEDHIAANADRWAAMEDDAFEAAMLDWKAAAPKGKVTPPAKTAMTAAAESDSGDSPWGALRLREHIRDLH